MGAMANLIIRSYTRWRERTRLHEFEYSDSPLDTL